MSYAGQSVFTGNPEDRGLLPKAGKVETAENDRVFRLTNINIATPSQPDMYRVSRPRLMLSVWQNADMSLCTGG
jgi:hypothetical protein